MTSNLGSADVFAHLPSDSREALQARVMDAVRGHFRPEFVNRCGWGGSLQWRTRGRNVFVYYIAIPAAPGMTLDTHLALRVDEFIVFEPLTMPQIRDISGTQGTRHLHTHNTQTTHTKTQPRVDEFIVFEPLTAPQIRDIVGLKTAALVARLTKQRVTLVLGDSALDYLADKVGGLPLLNFIIFLARANVA